MNLRDAIALEVMKIHLKAWAELSGVRTQDTDAHGEVTEEEVALAAEFDHSVAISAYAQADAMMYVRSYEEK